MSSFDGDNLFDSGPSRFHVGGRELRHKLLMPIDADGAAIRSEGLSARPIKQTGLFLANSLVSMTALTDAVENKLDGRSVTLVDHLDQTFRNVVMIQFSPDVIEQVGPRWMVRYTIDYVQVLP